MSFLKTVWGRICWGADTLWFNLVDLIARDCLSKSFSFVLVTGFFLWMVLKQCLNFTQAGGETLVALNPILILFVAFHAMAWILFVQKRMAPNMVKAFCVLISLGKMSAKDFDEVPVEKTSNEGNVTPDEKPNDALQQ
jgi:hypothetical protein